MYIKPMMKWGYGYEHFSSEIILAVIKQIC